MSPENFKFCSNSTKKQLDMDTVIEIKPWNGKSISCSSIPRNRLLNETLEQVFRMLPVCAMRRREDLAMGASYSDMLFNDDMGWIFISSITDDCNKDTLTETQSYFIAEYHCFDSIMTSMSHQNEIAVEEDNKVELNAMQKLYITNTPAVVEAFHSARNPIWNRLKHDESLFTQPQNYYCEIDLASESEVMLSGHGALFESQQSMKENRFPNNSIELLDRNRKCHGSNQTVVWSYLQNIMNNSHKMLNYTESCHQFMMKYSQSSEEDRVVFAVPVRGKYCDIGFIFNPIFCSTSQKILNMRAALDLCNFHLPIISYFVNFFFDHDMNATNMK